MYRIIIVEDDKVQNRWLAQFLRADFGAELLLECYASAEEFYVRPPAFTPDIALLDIQLPGDSGIRLAAYFNQTIPCCQIIYLTSFVDYAVEVYHTKHVWFVTKDRIEEMLPAALTEAKKKLLLEQQKVLRITLKDGICLIPQNEIIYLERSNRYTYIVAIKGTTTCSVPLGELIPQLDEAMFVRCHNSYVVNLRHIRYLRRTELQMSNDATVLVSRQYHAVLRDLFGKYISETMLEVPEV